jgi:hypothetical protein
VPCYTPGVQRRLRQIAVGLVGATGIWMVLLVLMGWFGDGCARQRTERRLAGSMKAKVSIGEMDIGLLTGSAELHDVRIEREDRGVLRMSIRRIDADLPPFGLALVSKRLGEVVVRGVDVQVTAMGVLDLRGASREPVTFERLDLRDAHVKLDAVSLLPGVAGLDLTIERAIAGRTTLRTPLSWIFSLRELRATVDLPAGATATLHYKDGTLRIAGSMFGSEPLELPFAIPVLEPARELEQLAEMGRALASELAAELGARFLEDKAKQKILLDGVSP